MVVVVALDSSNGAEDSEACEAGRDHFEQEVM